MSKRTKGIVNHLVFNCLSWEPCRRVTYTLSDLHLDPETLRLRIQVKCINVTRDCYIHSWLNTVHSSVKGLPNALFPVKFVSVVVFVFRNVIPSSRFYSSSTCLLHSLLKGILQNLRNFMHWAVSNEAIKLSINNSRKCTVHCTMFWP